MKKTRFFNKTTLCLLVSGLFLLTLLNACQRSDKYVKISTNMGDITLRLYAATPKHQDNFIKLIEEGFYNGTLFHRVIENFMIQGGSVDSKGAQAGDLLGDGEEPYTVAAEFVEGLYHKRGALAAARDSDDINPSKASSFSQFYIVQGRVFTDTELKAYAKKRALKLNDAQRQIYTSEGGSPHLDGSYTVFGEVVEGMEVVGKIATQITDSNNRPLTDVKMTVTIVEK